MLRAPALCGPDVGPVLLLARREALRMHNVRWRGALHHGLGQGVLPGSSSPQAPSRPWRHGKEQGVKKGPVENRRKRPVVNTEPRSTGLGQMENYSSF